MATKAKSVEVKETPLQTTTSTPVLTTKEQFPDPSSKVRLQDYEYNEKLFMGDHFEAFNLRIKDLRYNKDYEKLRYVAANFAGLLSKITADMLFSEPITITVPDGDQEFIDGLVHENKLNTQLYEAALTASSLGDAVFKLRVGPRNPDNPNEKSTVIIEETNPAVYFPKIDQFNVRQDPSRKEIAWIFKGQDGNFYLRKEIHTYGQIENKVFLMKGIEVQQEVGLEILGMPDLQPVEQLLIDDCLIVHVPNWKIGKRYFGISDYYDLSSLFYAINNRLTKIDNILDKHSDPILAVPTGVLDEKGHVKREALGMFELGEDGAKPEYIVWNANLESAFKEIDKLVETFFMVSETSPDLLGMGQGQADSGRALKLKLLRTIAKARRKRLYFDQAIKDIIYRAQLLAKAYGVEVNGKKLQGEPVVPEIMWQDGLPVDEVEQIDIETKKIDAGLSTKVDSIMRLDDVDMDIAEQKVKDIEKEGKLAMPKMNLGTNPFMNGNTPPAIPPKAPVGNNPPVIKN